MPKVVIDTNLLVRAAIGQPGSLPIMGAWLNGQLELIISADLLIELAEVLSRPALRKRIAQADAVEFIRLIAERATHITPQITLSLCRDPKDNFLLEVSAEGKVDYLITSDNDLLDDEALKQAMQSQFGVAIISLLEFDRILAA